MPALAMLFSFIVGFTDAHALWMMPIFIFGMLWDTFTRRHIEFYKNPGLTLLLSLIFTSIVFLLIFGAGIGARLAWRALS